MFSEKRWQSDSALATLPRRVHDVRTGSSGTRMRAQRHTTRHRLRPFRLQSKRIIIVIFYFFFFNQINQ